MSSGLREWLVRLALLIGSPVLFLGLSESALRLAGYGFEASFLIDGPGPGLLATNPKYGWRFFPRQIARTPVPALIRQDKPAGVTRVVVLGESAAMGFPDPLYSFAHQMVQPNLEVVNAAMTAINSHVIRDIASDCTRLHPDWVILYMGNNEVVGPGRLEAFGGWVKSFRLGQLLDSIAARLRPPPGHWRGMERLSARKIPHNDPQLENIYSSFRDNLRAIIRIARASGARVIVSTVAVNLRDSPPFAGEEALKAYLAGDYARARDWDELRFRADSPINRIIREETRSQNVLLLDAEQIVTADHTSFYEHVHLKPEANRKIAAGLLALMGRGKELPVTWDPWDLHRMERTIFALMQRPPFTFQPGYRTQQASIRPPSIRPGLPEPRTLLARERRAEILAELKDWKGAAGEYHELIAQLPMVKTWHSGLAEARLNLGQIDQAKAAYEAALALDPGFAAAHIGLGTVLAAQGQLQAAEERFRHAIEIDPSLPQGHNNLGRLYAARGSLPQAAESYRAALRANPEFAMGHYNLGSALAGMSHISDAIHHLEEATRLDSEFAPAHYDLGILYARSGRVMEAIERYQRTLAIDPRQANALNNWGAALARQGQRKEAIVRFEEALRVDPHHAEAKRNLAAVRSLNGH